MSGHSKWSTIKHQKAVTDKKRGKIFSKLAKAISIAAREGGSGDPDTNAKLRLAIDQARNVNMPKDNVKRAVERGLGKGSGADLYSVMYEAFGPAGSAILIECVTDNKNRTASEIKSFFDRGGGNLGSPGSASYLFEKKGLILLDKEDTNDVDEQILTLIDLGIEDVKEEKDFIEVYTVPNQLEEIKKRIDQKGFKLREASLIYKPKSPIKIEDESKKQALLKFLDQLDDFDDVQKIYCNIDF